RLFSSYDQQTVNTHFGWMAENGIDTAALQRFTPYSGSGFTIGGEGPTRNDMAVKVMNAAQTYGVKFYIMYDVSGWTSNAMPAQIEYDWTNVMVQLQITNSPMYAMQNGKPVVCIWGFGFNDSNHPWDAPTCTSVINWFKSQGCYIIGGVPTWWRTGVSDSRSNFLSAYSAFNMISPWMVGRIGNTNDVDNFLANPQTGDLAYCKANGIDYQPCVLPGDNGQRAHGDFMWRQFSDLINLGVQGIYISMFDEFNEGNQIACTAENASMEPVGTTNLYFTLDQDGVPCSSDYYLRLTGDGDKMLKGQIAFTRTRPTVPMLPPVIPAAPTGLTAGIGNGAVALNWTAVTGAADALSYNVKRSTLYNGTYTTIATNVGLISFADTNVSNGTTYYYVVSAVNSLGESSDSAPASVVPQTYYQVNSGGGAASPFMADAFFSSGTAGSTSAAIDTSGVTNPAPQAVYQTERWNNNTYTFPNLVAGASYKVRLHFAEIFYNAAGIRVFNVFINGTQVLTNFDIFAATGAKDKATLREFTATANGSGQMIIQYSDIAGKDNAKSSGIEILPLLAAPTSLTATPASNGQIELSWAASVNAASYNVKQSTVSGGPFTTSTNVTGLAYTNTGLVNGTLYYFVVSAANSFGESTNSAQVSARPVSIASPQLTFGINGGQIYAGWPADHTGWWLQMQTNSIGEGLGTNWVNVSGSDATNQISIPINNMNGSVFLRLVSP
ncbi:MAG TPA: malectin domain-containing carbohydrate-binding protein, partial [Candidatus Acidoferrum sp.]|nr:malectin domain-containing carbohydrate-binding protein [Candidatus Acidoferrum sp.]